MTAAPASPRPLGYCLTFLDLTRRDALTDYNDCITINPTPLIDTVIKLLSKLLG